MFLSIITPISPDTNSMQLRRLFAHPLSIASAIVLSSGLVAAAPTVEPDRVITDESAYTSDRFGTSLTRGTGFVAVGSPHADTPELSGGKVTVQRAFWIGPPEDPQQLETAMVEYVQHFDAGEGALFGADLAAHGDRLFIGSPGWRLNADIGTKQGAVFIYDSPPGLLATSTQLQMISPPTLDQYDDFGYSVACGLDSNAVLWLAIGLPGRNTDAGAVWMYQHDAETDTWTLRQSIQPASLNNLDRFGDAVALDGNLLVIGAPGTNEGLGAVHVRSLNTVTQTWFATDSVIHAHETASGEFGASVAVSGSHILIGAPHEDGHASLWNYISTAGLVVHAMDLIPDDWADIDGWGTDVAIDGTRALVGATPRTGSGSDGVSAIFRQTGTAVFQMLCRLGEADWGSDSRHGTAVLLHESTAWVGAPRAHVSGTSGGAVGRWDVSRTPGCHGDQDFDFIVNFDDLSALLGNWMSSDDSDLTGDGETDILDLLDLLEHWGSCI